MNFLYFFTLLCDSLFQGNIETVVLLLTILITCLFSVTVQL